MNKNKEAERVVALTERRSLSGGQLFKKVDIKYSDGSPFYSGWIQDSGDAKTGPTFFAEYYESFNLTREHVIKSAKYWIPIKVGEQAVNFCDATSRHIDEIIDLTFQAYFDGGYNRISAYQSLFHKIDNDHITLALTISDSVFGYLYINLKKQAFRGEAYFDYLFCAPNVRTAGFGHELIKLGLGRAKSLGFNQVSGTIIGNRTHCESIVRLLNKHGFHVADSAQFALNWITVAMLKRL